MTENEWQVTNLASATFGSPVGEAVKAALEHQQRQHDKAMGELTSELRETTLTADNLSDRLQEIRQSNEDIVRAAVKVLRATGKHQVKPKALAGAVEELRQLLGGEVPF